RESHCRLTTSRKCESHRPVNHRHLDDPERRLRVRRRLEPRPETSSMTTLAGITPIKDLPIENKRVFIRVDFNVPLEEQDGKQVITDDARIVEALPTIKHAI